MANGRYINSAISLLSCFLEYFVYDLMCLSDYKYEKFIERTEKVLRQLITPAYGNTTLCLITGLLYHRNTPVISHLNLL